MFHLTSVTALIWGTLLSAGAISVAGTELWAIRAHYGNSGLLAAHVLKGISITDSRLSIRRRRDSRWSIRTPTLIAIQVVTSSTLALGCLITLFVDDSRSLIFILWLPLLVCTVVNLAIQARTPAGQDGADQMASVVLVACAVGLLPGAPPIVADAAAWFIALQACLAYETAGVAKIISSDWRSGEAARLIFRTSSYGNPWLRKTIECNAILSRAMCLTVIAGECLFPLGVLFGGEFLLTSLAWGLIFHISVLVFMRLNTFLLAFPATYAALIYIGY